MTHLLFEHRKDGEDDLIVLRGVFDMEVPQHLLDKCNTPWQLLIKDEKRNQLLKDGIVVCRFHVRAYAKE